MKKETLIEEYKTTLNSFIEKIKFIYSEEFYKLDYFEQQRYVKDKFATECHLNSLSELLWQKDNTTNPFNNFFTIGLLSSIFGNGFGSTPIPSFPDKDTIIKEEK